MNCLLLLLDLAFRVPSFEQHGAEGQETDADPLGYEGQASRLLSVSGKVTGSSVLVQTILESFPPHQAAPGGRLSRCAAATATCWYTLSARIGQHMGGVAVHPGQPGNGDRDAGLLADSPDPRRRGRF